jgi:Mg2+ and Co2+ transporter CorA
MKITGYQIMSVSFSRNLMFWNTKQMKSENRGNSNLPGEDRDTVTISFLGQNSNSRIRNLMEQKQFLLERKNQWVNSALENGQDIKSIHDMLESYEEQLNELEQQISQEMARQNSGQPEKAQSSKKNNEPKTKQEIEQERISNLTDLSSGMSQIRTVQSSQTQVEGEARVLESEIKMDKGRMGDTEIIAKKEEKLSQLQQKAAELTANTVKISGEINEKIREADAPRVQEKSKEEQIKENNTIIRDLTGEYEKTKSDCRQTTYEQMESGSILL